MKLKNILMLFALVWGAFAFVACGDDGPTPDPSKANKEVVGTYTGWTHLETNFINKNYPDDTFTLALAEDGSLTATFKDATWGTATIKGIQASATGKDGEYKLSEADGTFVMNDIRSGGTQEFPCKLESATVSPKAKALKAVIKADMQIGHGEMTFTFQTGQMITPAE